MARKRTPTIPVDFAVQPLQPGQHAQDRVTCGECGLSWDDAIPTAWTPAPGGRCPFEYFHLQPSTRATPRITLAAAVRECLPDLEHYARTHGAGPDVRLAVLKSVLKRYL